MSAPYRALAQRIRLELDSLERTVAAIGRHWQQAKISGHDQDAYLNSVALNLHSFYSGLERVMELVAIEIDGGTLGGEAWPVELLRQMAMEVPSVRPAMVSSSTIEELDEYRRFRHLVRNIYATQLDPGRIEDLVQGLPTLWNQVRVELLAFAAFLDRVS